MKFIRVLICAAILAFQIAPAFAYKWGSIVSLGGRSEVSLTSFPNDFPWLNLFKTAASWNANDNSAMLPTDIDSNGWPLPSGGWVAKGGAKVLVNTPSQTERPGHYVLTWVNQAHVIWTYNGTGGSSTLVSCTGGSGAAFGAGVQCDNTACSSFTGSISSTTLTVTSAPTGTGCGLGQGVPISGSGVTVSTFGTPTIIISAGSACGGNTCYTVNQSQSVASTTMHGGARIEVSTSGVLQTTLFDTYNVEIQTTGSGSNYAQNFALFHVSDESLYWNSATPCAGSYGQACITSAIFQTRIKQANFSVLRDLDYMNANATNCSTWASRRPINYYSYSQRDEYRNAASGPGQYVNAGGTGASGGTVSYNAGTDTYSITLGSGNFQDKQTILWLVPTTGTTGSKVSLNGNTAVPITNSYGATASITPTSGIILASIYDATLGSFLSLNNNNSGAGGGLECLVPPEVFIEMNAELKTTPWHDVPFMAADAMTDWVTQYATYIKSNYPQVKPIFEVMNEPTNFSTPVSCYLSALSRAWKAIDSSWNVGGTFCGSSGNIQAEVAKMASTVGQDLNRVYGAGNYELLVNMGTLIGNVSTNAQMLTSTAYTNQTLIPVQSGYTQTPSYQYVTRVANNNYWNLGYQSVNSNYDGPRLRGIEAGLAYCYYNYSISSPCQGLYASAAAVMTQYFTSATGSAVQTNNVDGVIGLIQSYQSAAATCFTGTSRPGGCTLNSTFPLMMYEGGFAPNAVLTSAAGQAWTNQASNNGAQFTTTSGDIIQPILNATNASNAVLSVSSNANNGCVQGMTVAIASLAGGTWSGSAGNYTVQSATGTTCTINLNSTGLGTFGAARTTASAGWVAGASTISVASCSGVSANQAVFDSTTGVLISYVTSCSGTTLTLQFTDDAHFASSAGSNGDTLIFSSATITYTNSATWINFLRNMSYTAPELDTATTTLYTDLIANGVVNPSQYFMGTQGSGFFANLGVGYNGSSPWYIWATDVYGFLPVASCTSCTIASTTLTLGGTIQGIFQVGQTLIGGGTITGVATGAGSNTTITSCTPIGSNVCGTTAGDTLGLSQASTVSSGIGMFGSIAAPANNAANGTTSPVRAWGAICRWNHNAAQCNG